MPPITSNSDGLPGFGSFGVLPRGAGRSAVTAVVGFSPTLASIAPFFALPLLVRVARTLLAKPRKPNSVNSSSSRWPSQSRRFQLSQSSGIGTRSSSRTSLRLSISEPSAMDFFSASRSFGPPTSSAWAIRFSSVP